MTRRSLSTLALAWTAFAMAMTLPAPAHAMDRYWRSGSGSWNSSVAWTPEGVPQAGDNAHLEYHGGDGPFPWSVHYDASPSPVLNTLYIDTPVGGTMWLFQDNLTGLSASREYVGHDEIAMDHRGEAVYEQSDGTNTVGDLYLGFASHCWGRYELESPAPWHIPNLVASNEFIGVSGTGTFNQSGGNNTVSTLTIGVNHGCAGVYNLSGGTLSANSVIMNDGGTFNYSGGAFSYGAVTINSGGTLYNSSWWSNNAALTNNAGGTLWNTHGLFNYGTLSNAGIIYNTNMFGNMVPTTNFGLIYTNSFFGNSSTFTNYGSLINGGADQGQMTNYGTLINYGSLENDGQLTNSNTLTNSGSLANAWMFENAGTLTNAPGALLSNGRTLENTGILTNALGASLYNSSLLTNGRGLDPNQPALLTNYGSITGTGTFQQTNRGETTNCGSMGQASIEIGSGTLLTNSVDATLAIVYSYQGYTGSSNAGTIDNRGTMVFGEYSVTQNSGTISNSGTMAISDNTFWTNYGTFGTSGTLSIGGNSRLTNYGVLANSGTLNTPGGSEAENYGTVINTGSIECDYIENYSGATIDNSGTMITHFLLADGVVTNSGTLSSRDAGAYWIATGAFSNSGTINNGGWVELDSGMGNTGTLNNVGLWQLFAPLDNSGTVNNRSGGTLQNYDGLGNSGLLINDIGATVISSADWGYPGTLTNSGTLANAGAIVGSGHYVQTGGLTTNTGSMSQANVDVQGGSFVADGTITVSDRFSNAGVLSGEGTIHGTVENDGLVSPGSSLGMLNIDGNYRQSTGGTLVIELGGLAQYDWLNITGTADLDGHLEVDLFAGFVPTDGNEFDFLTASGGVFGAFQDYDLPYGLSHWDIGYRPDRVTLTYLEGTPDVPEPGTVVLLVVGLAGMVAFRKRLLR